MLRILQHHASPLAFLVLALLPLASCHRNSKKDTASRERAPSVARMAAKVVEVDPEPQGSLVTPTGKAKQAAHDKVIDPRHDGWDTEVISSAVQTQLELLLGATAHDSANHTHNLVTPDFTSSELRPKTLEEKELLGGVVVRSGIPKPAALSWDAAATRLYAPFKHVGDPEVHVKVVRVERGIDSPGEVSTRCLIEIVVVGEQRTVEQHLEWQCRWTDAYSSSPRLRSVVAKRYQESQSSGQWFVDRSEHVLGTQSVYRDQLRYGLNHWLSRIEVTHGMYVFAEYGLAIADVNNDGLDDVYICQPGGLPNRLLMHQPDGSVRDVSAAAGVHWLDQTSSALFADFDNDGDQDLAIALESRRVLLMTNRGDGVFQLAQELAIEDRHVQGLCAADFNNDSMLDLYLTVGFADERARPHETRPSFSYHDANEGGANVLFQNMIVGQRWNFRDVTREAGLDENNRRHSLAASWEDFDNDGDLDLYVANDYGQNCLYQNNEGQFTDIAVATGVVDFGSGMSVSWADYDRDGWMDLLVGNMFSSAGNRITHQNKFRTRDAQDTRAVLARFAKGNTLFKNDQGRVFEEPVAGKGVQMGRWAWSSPFVDLNNDGWSDVFVANGYVTGPDERDL